MKKEKRRRVRREGQHHADLQSCLGCSLAAQAHKKRLAELDSQPRSCMPFNLKPEANFPALFPGKKKPSKEANNSPLHHSPASAGARIIFENRQPGPSFGDPIPFPVFAWSSRSQKPQCVGLGEIN